MRQKKFSLAQVEEFIRKGLPGKLKRDLALLRMVKEADLECCVYYHLREYLHLDKRWRIFTRKHSPQTEHFIDVLIFHDLDACISMELKWDRRRISSKDRGSLDKSIKSLRVKRAIFLATCIGNEGYEKIKKKEIEKNHLFELIIPLGMSGDELKEWKNRRRSFKRIADLGSS